MRAAITPAPNGPITIEEVADPVAADGEVLVEVHAASVNRLDRAVYEGRGLGRAATFPLIQGLDAAGVILEGGRLEKGMRVVIKPTAPCGRCRWCRSDRDADCTGAQLTGIHRPGGFAEYVAVPEANVFPIPATMTYEVAAAAAHVFPVALHMIRTAGLSTGETVFVTAGAGAIGSAAIQLARALGAEVLAACSTGAKAAVASRLGATVLTTRGDDLEAVDSRAHQWLWHRRRPRWLRGCGGRGPGTRCPRPWRAIRGGGHLLVAAARTRPRRPVSEATTVHGVGFVVDGRLQRCVCTADAAPDRARDRNHLSTRADRVRHSSRSPIAHESARP